MTYVGNDVVLSATGTLRTLRSARRMARTIVGPTHNPESNPLCPLVLVSVRATQGAANVLCVTVWFFCRNWNVTVSPIWAVMFDGLNARMFGPPTTTVWSEESDVGLAGPVEEGAAAGTLENVIGSEVVLVFVIVTKVEVGPADYPVALEGGVDVSESTLKLGGSTEDVLAAPPVAAIWNAGNWSPGLMAKTMPCRQWFVWRQ